MRAFTFTTPAKAAQVTALALLIAASLSACDRRAEGEAGDRSPETGATTPAPTDTPPSDPASGMGTTATTPTTPSPMTTMPPSGSTVPGAGAGAALNSADQAFLAEATRSNEEEIATTNLGIERGNAKNKALSQKLHSDHMAMRSKVAALMPNASPPPTASAPADLSAAEGEAFNTELLDTYREQHEAAIRKFTDASNNPALSEPVRTLARDALPTLQEHLKSVQDARGG